MTFHVYTLKQNFIVNRQTFSRTVFRPQCSIGSLTAREPSMKWEERGCDSFGMKREMQKGAYNIGEIDCL